MKCKTISNYCPM